MRANDLATRQARYAFRFTVELLFTLQAVFHYLSLSLMTSSALRILSSLWVSQLQVRTPHEHNRNGQLSSPHLHGFKISVFLAIKELLSEFM
jgi:hypothetical protein